ncbi:MAG: monovalent cation:proton antiporter-2 (CPA2) family protein [Gammaproteobacteria bacterium]|nr:monovalent cation:proton antiporter-2 (CPA2) family protein [Gammaproteobacteria bacterium]MDH5226182.1 monovalent cation:proton antiporter-2 (CPA2) family protein [Gammaproteobacteria bacterium]
MATEAAGLGLGHAVALLAAAVVAVPLFRKLGLGAVLGYLCAGLLIGPFGLGLFHEPQAILHVAELGIVLFLFLIGLEMRPTKLWALRRDIFGLGLTQVLVCSGLLTLAGMAFGWPPTVAMIGAMGFVLSSTAVIMKMLDERGQTAEPAGQRAVSILLLEDLAIIPLLALVAFLGLAHGHAAESARPAWITIATALGALAVLVAIGRWAINPLFRIVAALGGRDVMTAAALLVVLGAALFMQWGGLSMAMGAFIAGVLLSESTFRHQLEADIEPFRGILLGLFFLSVGMSLDVAAAASEWQLVAGGVVAFMAVKAIGVFGVARAFGADPREALLRSAQFAQGGEFAFVLYAAALAAGVFDASASAVMSAIVILSMALTPIVMLLLDRFLPAPQPSMHGIEEPPCLTGRVLIIGFGRFGQVVSQPLLARDVDISIIDADVDMIRAAGNFGFKVYYGDGTRLDVLRTSGAGKADAILVCIDKPQLADRIVELAKHEFPQARLYVRSFDRGHTLRLIQAGVDYQIRETFESAMVFGENVLRGLGYDAGEISETMTDVRQRDQDRLGLQLIGGIAAGRSLMRNNQATPEPAPLVRPKHESRGLNPEAAQAIDDGETPA